jgi:hypothetical protein
MEIKRINNKVIRAFSPGLFEKAFFVVIILSVLGIQKYYFFVVMGRDVVAL